MRKLKLEKLIICPITGYGAKIPSQDSPIPLLWYLPGVRSITYIIFPGKPELVAAPPPLSLGRMVSELPLQGPGTVPAS